MKLSMLRFEKSVFVTAAAAVLAVGATFVVAGAQEKKSSTAEKKSAKGERSPPSASSQAFSPEREAAAMRFVRAHHPEVADLLGSLRTSRPDQYRRAARELFRSSERVSQWKERDAARYDLELTAWKVNSQIQLLLARSTMSPEVDVEGDLKSLLAQRIETRLALRKLDREQLAKRLAAANADIERLSGDRDAAVERQLAQMTQKIKVNRQRVKNRGTKNAKKPEADQADRKREDAPDNE
jgi:hypothetical protein